MIKSEKSLMAVRGKDVGIHSWIMGDGGVEFSLFNVGCGRI